jgi:hypothetical protein
MREGGFGPPPLLNEGEVNRMRFVSPHRNFQYGVRGGVPAHLGPDGKMVPEQRELVAKFSPDLRTDADLAFAKSTFNFRGLPIREGGQEISPAYRVSVFDSEVAALQNGWTSDEEALVVEALRAASPSPMFAEIVPVAAEKPWNGYDELVDADRIVELALAIDADLDKVAQYETENLNREDVIEALKAAVAEADETIIVSA